MAHPARRSRETRRFRPLRAETLEPRLALAGDITTGLVHYWPFDETGGDTVHDVAGGADGALVNYDTFDARWGQGRVGGALEFSNPVNAVVAQPDPMSGSYAVSFWLNVFDRQGTNPRVFQSRVDNEIIVDNDSSRSVGYYYRGARVATADSSVPTFNTWEHYAINFNTAGQGVVYHNGVPVAVGGFADSESLSSWVFGHSSDMSNTTDSLHGMLDDLRVYNRLLTDDDIALLARQGAPERTHEGPVHYWTFDESSGFTAHDSEGDADGILLNWDATEPRWAPGKVGGALAFNTADNAVVTAPAFLHAEWTVAFWVDLTAYTGVNPRVIGPQDGRELWAYLDLENNGGGAFMSHEIRTFDTKTIPLNSWQHYAITFDADSDVGTIYRNGVPVATGVFHDNATLQAWVIGHNCDLANNVESLNGLLDDLRVYDRQLSLTDIRQLAALDTVSVENDAYETTEDTLLDVPATIGVLENDSSLDSNFPMTRLVLDAEHGTVQLGDDGSFTYQPEENYNGPDSFQYSLTDLQGELVIGTAWLTVKPIDDPPSFDIGADQFVHDNSGEVEIVHWASQVSAGGADEADQKLTFTCTADRPELLAVQPQLTVTGDGFATLSFALKPNVVGDVTVTVVLHEDGGGIEGNGDTTEPETFQIHIQKGRPGHNELNGLDADGDRVISANDAVVIINRINARGAGPVDPATEYNSVPFCDVTGDGQIVAEDVVTIINYINAHPELNTGQPEWLELDGDYLPMLGGLSIRKSRGPRTV